MLSPALVQPLRRKRQAKSPLPPDRHQLPHQDPHHEVTTQTCWLTFINVSAAYAVAKPATERMLARCGLIAVAQAALA